MGREWLYRAGDGGGGRRKTSSTTAKQVNGKTRKERNASSGCMNAIFNFFDIQHHHFPFHHPSFISQSHIDSPKQSNFPRQGVVAQKNNLKSPESGKDVHPSSSNVKEQPDFKITMGGIKIKTKQSTRLITDDVSSECSNSPGVKTPNLVARLMGLDLLPEYSSPRPSSSSTPVNSHRRSSCSLPATPRLSTSSRRSMDNDYHHRLSLQIDKENRNSYKGEEHETTSLQMRMARRRSELLVNGRPDDEHTSEYAKQIANQVRERISRRIGTDITNTILSPPTTTRNKEQRRDSNLVLLKPKKPPPSPAPATKAKQDDSRGFSRSPELRLLDVKSNFSKPNSNPPAFTIKEVPSRAERVPVNQTTVKEKRYDFRRLKKMHQEEEAFISKKKKSTPLPNVKNTTKFQSFKKEMTSSSSTARLPQKQVSLVSMSSSRISNIANHTHALNLSDQISKRAATSSSALNRRSFSHHFNYISTILNHCGINTTTIISVSQWYSPSHPLNPAIFHQIEKLYHSTAIATGATAKRRMIFELVDEFLMKILKPWVCSRRAYSCGMRGSELVGKLCEMIGNIPAADCEVLEDIDELIGRDMGRSTRRLFSTAFEEVAEEIVKVIGNEIEESLVHEMAAIMVAPARSDRLRSHVSIT